MDYKTGNIYDDIISLPHPVSPSHPRMAAIKRAAQFAPFAALAGFDTAVRESARLTCERRELDEDYISSLNNKLRFLNQNINNMPYVSITYFKPDQSKSGGSYPTTRGTIKKIDTCNHCIEMNDGAIISFTDIVSINLDNEFDLRRIR